MAMTTLHRLDDLARPRLPWPIWTLNRALAPLAGRVQLDDSTLLSTAMKKTGLTDFGDDRFREPLRLLVAALEREAKLSTLGRVLLHEMACDLPHEETQLLAVDLSTMLFEWTSHVPSYRDWYRAHDQTPAYRYLRKLLQALQWLRGGARWVLKSPQHLEQLRQLLAVFPDAKIVQTHRDPVAVTASLCTLLAYVARMQTEHVDLSEVGRYWSARVEDLLRASVRDRALVPADQVLDVRFHEFMADEMTMVKRVYAFAGQPMTEERQRAVESFMAANPRGRVGRIE